MSDPIDDEVLSEYIAELEEAEAAAAADYVDSVLNNQETR